ncbi:MAG: hypothetical protein ACK4YO_04065, partial [Candidatus Altarchaeaceae archaeon]
IYTSGRRAKNDFNKVSIEKRIILKYENGEWMPINKKIEDIIGVDDENFRRIFIIPQGKFEEILTLEPRERAEMMKELFNLDKYDLFEKAKKLEEKNEEKIKELEGKCKAIISINIPEISYNELADENTNNEIIKILEEKEKLLEKRIEELSKELEIKRKKEEELLKSKEIIERRNKALEEYENLKKHEEEYE